MPRLAYCLLLLIALPATATTVHVPGDAAGIQVGLDLAQSGDTVLVACGTYFEHGLVMPSGVTLRSENGHWDCVTIDAQELDRVILCENLIGGALIEGFTLQNGRTADVQSDAGGGIYIRNATTTLRNCRIQFNTGSYGNGVAIYQSAATVENCWIRENHGDGGGGGLWICRGDPIVRNSVIDSNSAWDGGGVWISGDASPQLEDCLFLNNYAEFWGGAVGAQGDESAPNFNRCTFYGNAANWHGGVFWVCTDCRVTVENSILAFSRDGGGVHLYEDSADPMVDLICCDIFANVGGDFGGEMPDVIGLNGNISANPFFCDASGGDFTLSLGSPCLPAGNDCGVLMGAFDLGCDIATSVEDSAPAAALSLIAAPNPFNPETTLRFTLAEPARVTLTVHAVDGRRVASPIEGEMWSAGAHALSWRPEDLSSGCYLARLRAGDKTVATRLILLK